MYFWLFLQIHPCNLRLLLCSRVTYMHECEKYSLLLLTVVDKRLLASYCYYIIISITNVDTSDIEDSLNRSDFITYSADSQSYRSLIALVLCLQSGTDSTVTSVSPRANQRSRAGYRTENRSNVTAVRPCSKPYRCNVCGAQFNRPANLKTHSRIHSGEKPYKCETCGSRFVQVKTHPQSVFLYSDNAKQTPHVLIHTGEKPYPCDICGTRFRHLQTLKSHLRIHTGEKPYHCENCDLHFRHKSQLRLHLRQKHGAKPYPCDICGTRFRHLQTLKSHLRIHTGEKPYHVSTFTSSTSHFFTYQN
uniref:C2H2-type domain-containing protein n=1 Tax=Sinocyclocheilus grahami TaxID=75366 RepID=A0A672PKU1_SINGR